MGENETLTTVVKDIVAKLESWRGINEAATTQAIILRVLQALGWDIWNPYEVVPQDTGAKYRPDFVLRLKKDRPVLVVEVKALDKTPTDDDRTQVVNYANGEGIRWSILTNGKLWEFFDNNKVEAKAPEKRVLYFDLDNPSAAEYLKKTLSKSFWENEKAPSDLADIAETIRKEIQTRQSLAQVKEKLRKALEEEYQRNEKGLRKAMENELSANERELAELNFGELVQELLDLSLTDPTEALKEKLKRYPATSGLTVEINGEKFFVKSWREFYCALVETAIHLGKKDVIKRLRSKKDIVPTPSRKTKSGKLYDESAFRKLSSGEYLFVHLSSESILRKLKVILSDLEIPFPLRVKDKKGKESELNKKGKESELISPLTSNTSPSTF
ncbi:type I restriction enzyme HsdR N-terminal domain-containing protein [Thermus thermophilus]|uniref:type I restriction enzyme HsdR N-terminal domain-containing protein n=1 Tax=Thermus thermophilus TaxID=274 RepID=UPI000BBA82CF|nr:type I restriction enzyme HsdR N-terminal domain-containing protein [Thermus thermophilus]